MVDADEKEFVDDGVPNQVAGYSNAMAELVRRLCLEHRVDIVQLEYTQMAEYRDHTGAVPLVLVEHDITFALYDQLAQFSPDPKAKTEYLQWLAFERSVAMFERRMDHVGTRSGNDCKASPRSTVVVPNGVDLDRFQPALDRAAAARSCLSDPSGTYRTCWRSKRCETTMPSLWRACPDAKLHVIAGPDHERAAPLANARYSRPICESLCRVLWTMYAPHIGTATW